MRHRRDRQGHAVARVRRRAAGGDLRHLRRARVRHVHDLHQQPQAAARPARVARHRRSSSHAAVLHEVDRLGKQARAEVETRSSRPGIAAPTATQLLDCSTGRRSIRHGADRRCALRPATRRCAEGIDELAARLRRHARARRARATSLKINLSIVRGLDYYTGTVYETFLDEHPELGSICSGGRYDNLAGPLHEVEAARRRHLDRRDPAVLAAARARTLIGAARGAVAQVLVLNVEPALARRLRASSRPSCAPPGSTSRSTAATTSSASSSSTPIARRSRSRCSTAPARRTPGS